MVVIAGAAAFATRLGFTLRASLLLGLTYLSGTLWLAVSGLPGTGRIYLIMFVVLAALLLNRWSALLVWILSLVTIGAIYSAFVLRLIPLPTAMLERVFNPPTLTTSWIVQMLVSHHPHNFACLAVNGYPNPLLVAFSPPVTHLSLTYPLI
jgi:hypothetical protein